MSAFEAGRHCSVHCVPRFIRCQHEHNLREMGEGSREVPSLWLASASDEYRLKEQTTTRKLGYIWFDPLQCYSTRFKSHG
ncbi:hypothetical protein Bpfe_028152 [Biomphalaria pfeifferi]|uniref:Uncharacterized protein n=1 Tax=Biomphalaria pfeifferi TaxID=112525 RepID=A0AAD8ATZ7_BIOPF|nr:hypothetical protein Bpfe_028152 [Biomphalaria pfeifferi]